MILETAMVFNRDGKVIYWHEPPDRNSSKLPDSDTLWDVLWDNRDDLGGVAHTHPWRGTAYPSYEDVTTFAAIELALKKRLKRELIWPIVTFSEVVYFVRNPLTEGPAWIGIDLPDNTIRGFNELRRRSEFSLKQKDT